MLMWFPSIILEWNMTGKGKNRSLTVASADTCGGDLDNNIVGMLNLGQGDALDGDLERANIMHRLHL